MRSVEFLSKVSKIATCMLFVNAVLLHSWAHITHVIEAAAKKQAQLQAKKDAAESECHIYFIFMMLNYLVQTSS